MSDIDADLIVAGWWMSSSKRTGASGEAVAAEPQIAPTSATGADSEDGELADPWFTPGPKSAASTTAEDDVAAAPFAADDVAAQDDATGWFLPAGRAGLLPDSMTESWDEAAPAGSDHVTRQDAASAPPWGAESANSTAGVPPPWENGPWPGPGESRAQASASVASAPPEAIGSTTAWLRRRPAQVGLAAAAGLVVLIVIIVVITAGNSGGSCGTYPPAVRHAYTSAMSDLRSHAPASVLAAALGQAASQANAAAAATSQINVRTALSAMASDLDLAHADVTAHRALAAALIQRLTADGTALPASCSS